MQMPSSFPTCNFKHFKPTDLCIVKPILSSKTNLSEVVSSLDLLHPKGIRLPSNVLVTLLRHCSDTNSYREGKLVHLHLKLTGFKRPTTLIANHLIHMYFCCSYYVHARKVFEKMEAYSWATLVAGYALCGDMESAAEMFSQMPKKKSYSWTSFICGYAINGMGYKALEVFRKMIKHQVRPDKFTFSNCLSACATIASLKYGKQIHAFLVRNNVRRNPIVVSAIVDMYAKCRSMETFCRVFNFSGNLQDVVFFNTMISGLAYYGYGKEAIMVFTNILKLGVKPNRTSSGLVHEGLQFFLHPNIHTR